MIQRNLLKYYSSVNLVVTAMIALVAVTAPAYAQPARERIRIANASLSVTALPLIAAKEWKLFEEQGFDPEIILISPAISAPALISGEIDYVAGVGPGSVSATLGGLPLRAVWFSSDRVSYSLIVNPKFKNVQDLRGKKIGVTGSLGATNHVSLVIALKKLGMDPRDFTILALPAAEMLRSLESGFIDAASLNPPAMFFAEKKGFTDILDIGSLVEMPGGGLTALTKTIEEKPDEIKRVILALQTAKDRIRESKAKSVELLTRILKMDKEIASETYDVFLKTLSKTGIPSRTGMENLVKSIHARGRFVDKKPAFSDLADDHLAKGVAKALGYKVP